MAGQHGTWAPEGTLAVPTLPRWADIHRWPWCRRPPSAVPCPSSLPERGWRAVSADSQGRAWVEQPGQAKPIVRLKPETWVRLASHCERACPQKPQPARPRQNWLGQASGKGTANRPKEAIGPIRRRIGAASWPPRPSGRKRKKGCVLSDSPPSFSDLRWRLWLGWFGPVQGYEGRQDSCGRCR